MTAIELALALLRADAGIAAYPVPADAIMGGELPEGTQPPALVANTISIVEQSSLTRTPLIVSRIQVTIFAANYQQQVDLVRLVRAALANQRVNAGGVPGASIRADSAGPDFRDDTDAGLWMQMQDFRVSIPA